MHTHWTYDEFDPKDDLLQGDILESTGELRSILEQVHPHFLDPKYTAFLLVTQSCDLVVRNGRCGTRYLNIAVIRPLGPVLHDFLSHVCRSVVEGVYLQESKKEAHRLLQRLFNQNEQALGLFYLHGDRAAGISIPSVSLLRVTVALRADHYETLKQARRGRLCPEFRGKLGWLVGNLYSRVATPDWSEPPERNKAFEELVERYLGAEGNADVPVVPVWVPETWVLAAKEKGIQLEQFTREEVVPVLEAHKPLPAKTRVIDQAIRVLKEILETIDNETLVRFHNRLNNDKLFANAVRSARSEQTSD